MPDGLLIPKPPTLRTISALIEAGLVNGETRAALDEVAARYAIAIPPALAALIARPDDPIGRQFIPHPGELAVAAHESADPVADEALSPVPGVVHRYSDRALLKPLLACPVYCRFCFRREQVGPDGGLLSDAELAAAFAYLAGQTQIREVILTGGDPLILSPRRLSHIHTRAPVADPSLVTDAMADVLDIKTPLFIALHANHASELTAAVRTALEKLQRRGIPILGQTVLLAGVNDSDSALGDLFRAMLRARIKPYYLHQLDAAPGTARFYVPPERGREILANLRGKISGTALPTYIYDRPGGLGKIPL
jgi:lysine 2,3-aminomutase